VTTDWLDWFDPISLDTLGRRYGTDKCSAGHAYLRYYEHHLGYLRHEPIRLLEFGVWHAASLKTWEAWFDKATIVGVDIAPQVVYNTERVETVIADFMDLDPSKMGEWDVIIDDCSHDPAQIQTALLRFWPYVRSGGWYIIEDVDSWAVAAIPIAGTSWHLSKIGCHIVFHQREGVASAHGS